jgi:hypothetical protein
MKKFKESSMKILKRRKREKDSFARYVRKSSKVKINWLIIISLSSILRRKNKSLMRLQMKKRELK